MGIRDTVLQMAPSSLSGPLVAILAPHLGQPVNVVTHTVADLGSGVGMKGSAACYSEEGLKRPCEDHEDPDVG